MVPRWLGAPDDPEDEGARVLHTITLMMDATIERVRQGLDARFPSRTGEAANALTAADRGILRGRDETLSTFALRLKAWRYPRTHRVRGNAFVLLEQVRAYWRDIVESDNTGTGMVATTVAADGLVHKLFATGAVTKVGIAPWDWDGALVTAIVPTVGTASNTLGGGTLTPAIPSNAPGALLVAHAFAEGGTLITPTGWTLLASHSPSGANLHAVYARVSTGLEGTTLSVDATATSGRAIAHVVHVPAQEFDWRTPLADNFDVLTSTGAGTSVAEPALDDAQWTALTLAFVGYDSGGTVNAFTGGDATWTEAAAEAVAGSAGAGVGVQAQYAHYAAGDASGAGACTLGNTASHGVIALRVRRPWARFWVTLTPGVTFGIDETPALGDAALWGGALGTPGYTLGQVGVTPADVLAMRNLFQQYAWNPEHARPEWVVLSVDGSDPAPDGTWLHWSNAVQVGADVIQTPARSPDHRYWSLSPLENNVYTGDPESFCDLTYMPDGTTYAGDPEESLVSWGPITLPDGTTYAGDPESFPIDVLLLDDGTTP